jgi:hypothetical protein
MNIVNILKPHFIIITKSINVSTAWAKAYYLKGTIRGGVRVMTPHAGPVPANPGGYECS